MYYDDMIYKRNYRYNSNMRGSGMQYQNMMYMGAEDVGEEIISFSEALDLIRASIENEREDESFYEKLIEVVQNDAEKEMIKSIRDDEIKHNNILRYLYYTFTGMMPRETRYDNISEEGLLRDENKKNEYEKLLKEAWLGELGAVKKYRKILGAMPDKKSQILINSILTDELIHANKYNYLITKNK